MLTFVLDTPPEQVPAKLFHEIVHDLRDPRLGLLTDGDRHALDLAAFRYLKQGDNRARIEATYRKPDGSPPDAATVHEEAIARVAEAAQGLIDLMRSKNPKIAAAARKPVMASRPVLAAKPKP